MLVHICRAFDDNETVVGLTHMEHHNLTTARIPNPNPDRPTCTACSASTAVRVDSGQGFFHHSETINWRNNCFADRVAKSYLSCILSLCVLHC
jgi:hypothetical protein